VYGPVYALLCECTLWLVHAHCTRHLLCFLLLAVVRLVISTDDVYALLCVAYTDVWRPLIRIVLYVRRMV